MPVGEVLSSSSTDSILSKSLDKLLKNPNGSSLDENLKSAHHSSLLNCSLKFKVSEQMNNSTLANLGQRYSSLQNGNGSPKIINFDFKLNKTNHNSREHDDGIPKPKIKISEIKDIKLTWQQLCPVGSGLKNLGNSCFMNAVLQCLTYLPPLYNSLIEDNHANNCCYKGFCSLCEVQKHLFRALKYSGMAISPTFFFNNLGKIGNFVKYKQEDAHEFLRHLLSHMEKCALEGFKARHSISVDPASSRTTVINNIFGGYNRSQVVCLKCKETSNTYDPFMDIMVDIKHTDSLDGAIAKYIQSEMLEGDNAYQCQRCKCKVPAQKRVTLHRMPAVCTFQLKRFQFHNAFGSKIGKWIRFPEKLNLRPYMSDSKGPPVLYILRGLVVHLGHSMQNGHYCAYIRNSKGNFYCMNDDSVSSVDKSKVFAQHAYILFYTKIPQVQKSYDSTKMNGNSGFSSSLKNEVQTSNKSQDNSQKPSTQVLREVEVNSKPSPEKITPQNYQNKINKSTKQPRIVIKIKNGRVNSLDNKVPQSSNSKCGLVPYTEDSDNGSDQDAGIAVNGNHEINRTVNGHDVTPAIHSQPSSSTSDNKLLNGTVQDSSSSKGKNAVVPVQTKSPENRKLVSSISVNTAIPTVPLFKRVRRLSGSLPPVNISQSPSRLNASGNWSVTENKNQEPSVASSSSSATSVNSSVDNWTVTGHETDGPNVDKRSCIGWTVANSPCKQSIKADKLKCDANSESVESNLVKKSEDGSDRCKEVVCVSEGDCQDDAKSRTDVVKCDGDDDGTREVEETLKSANTNVDEATEAIDATSNGASNLQKKSNSDGEDSDSSYEVEWVEKTKETIENDKRKRSRSKEEKSFQDYEREDKQRYGSHHYKDRHFKGNKEEKNNQFEQRPKRKSYPEFANGSIHSYGPTVKSWNGNASEINVQVEREQRLKRWATDDYDEEFDAGKTKKMKRSYDNKKYKFTQSLRGAYDQQCYNRNSFQKHNSYNNYDRRKHHEGGRGGGGNHYRHHSFHGKSHSYNNYNGFRRHSFHSNSHRWDKNR